MVRKVAIVMNGVTGRMGTRQHLVGSVLAIREQGGVELQGGEVVVPVPILVGRNEEKLRSLAEAHGIERWSTDLSESLADPEVEIYFDSQTTTRRTEALAVWNPDLPDTNDYRSQWLGVPQDEDPANAFKIQWEMFLRHVLAGEPFPYDLLEGAKGVQLAELGLRSWRERRWLEVPELEPSRTPQEELDHA